MIGFGQGPYTHKLDSILIYDSNTSVFEEKWTFTYDINNNNTLVLGTDYLNITENVRIENTFDVNSNLILITASYWNSALSIFELDEKIEYTYDINNNLILKMSSSWNSALSIFEFSNKHEYTYDINNNLILKMSSSWNSALSIFEFSNKHEYTYDINNNLILKMSSSWNSAWDLNGKSEHIYDLNNNKISDSIYNWNNGVWGYAYGNVLTYDLLLLTNNTTYPFGRDEFESEFEEIYNNAISTSMDEYEYVTYHYSAIGITFVLNFDEKLKKLKRITNMLGQETPLKRNTPLFYIYDDGTVEKRIVIE